MFNLDQMVGGEVVGCRIPRMHSGDVLDLLAVRLLRSDEFSLSSTIYMVKPSLSFLKYVQRWLWEWVSYAEKNICFTTHASI